MRVCVHSVDAEGYPEENQRAEEQAKTHTPARTSHAAINGRQPSHPTEVAVDLARGFTPKKRVGMVTSYGECISNAVDLTRLISRVRHLLQLWLHELLLHHRLLLHVDRHLLLNVALDRLVAHLLRLDVHTLVCHNPLV